MTQEEKAYLAQFEIHMKLAKRSFTTSAIADRHKGRLLSIYRRYFTDVKSIYCYGCAVTVMRGLYDVYFNDHKPLDGPVLVQKAKQVKQKKVQNEAEKV